MASSSSGSERTFRFSPRPNSAHQINWQAWGAEAFEAAATKQRPIALFITAFWCGICQRLDETALSDPNVQLLLNAYFVPIRVEEAQRPDVDVRYNQEGWPTIVFLTPWAEPIVTVNALDTEPLIDLLVRLVDAHDKHRAELAANAPAPLEPEPQREPDPGVLTATVVDEVVALLRAAEDPVHGGFGGPHKYFYADALRFYLDRAEARFLLHVKYTLDAIANSAMYDSRDGGFFRYSSKPDWNEPHPEKLLGDQADLLQLYLLLFERTGETRYRAIAERLIAFLEDTLGPPAVAPFFAGCQDFVRAPETQAWVPVIDTMVYCDANARAASALLLAGRVLDDARCRGRAHLLLERLWQQMRAPSGGMFHYFDGARAHAPGLLVDAVAMGMALLDDDQVDRATELGHEILRRHLNPGGGFFDIAERGPAALQRPLTELTQNASAALFFLRLAEARRDARLREAAQWALLGYGGSLDVYGPYAARFGTALERYLAS